TLETALAGTTSMVGAVAGTLEAAGESVNSTTTGRKVDSFWESFIEKLPNAVHENMARYMYSPRTEDGKAIEGMFGLAMEELASWGSAAGDKVMEHGRANDWDPETTAIIAAAARTAPEAGFLLAPFAGAKGMSIKRAYDAKVKRRMAGENVEAFDQALIRRYGDPSKHLREGIKQRQDELAILYDDVSPDPMKRQYILHKEAELTKLIEEEARIANKTGETVMNPREVVDLATEEQILKMNEEAMMRSLKGEDNMRPVVVEKTMEGTTILSGLESAFDAAIFGEREIPVKLITQSIPKGARKAEVDSMNNMYDSWLIIEHQNLKRNKLPRSEKFAED
ncbi:unnamed protein product, partial [marine sediment metagenome]